MLPYQKVDSKSLIACVCVHSLSQDLSQVSYVGSELYSMNKRKAKVDAALHHPHQM